MSVKVQLYGRNTLGPVAGPDGKDDSHTHRNVNSRTTHHFLGLEDALATSW